MILNRPTHPAGLPFRPFKPAQTTQQPLPRFGARRQDENNLHKASRQGDIRTMAQYLDQGANVNQAGPNGLTPLMEAAKEGRLDAVSWLLAYGAEKNLLEPKGQTSALGFAAKKGYDQVVARLIQAQAHFDQPDAAGNTPLLSAVGEGHRATARLLLTHGANVNHINGDGHSPLSMAAWNRDLRMVELLFKAGASPEHTLLPPLYEKLARERNFALIKTLLQNKAPLGPQHRELSFKLADRHVLEDPELLKLLLGAGLNPDTKQKKKAFLSAMDLNYPEAVEAFLTHGLLLDKLFGSHQPLLNRAVAKGSLPLTRIFLAHGLPPNQADAKGNTPFMLAAEKGHLEIMTALLDKIDPVEAIEQRNQQWLTPLMLAARNGHPDVVSLLIQAGADVNQKNSQGQTAMHQALSGFEALRLVSLRRKNMAKAQRQYDNTTHIIQALLDKKANPNLRDNTGNTPLKLALAANHPIAVRMLLDAGANIREHEEALAALLKKQARTEKSPFKTVMTLLDKGVDPALARAELSQLLFDPRLLENKAHLEKVLTLGNADPNVRIRRSRNTPLIKTVDEGKQDATTTLIKHGAALDLSNRRGDTALTRSIQLRRIDQMEALLDKGADPEKPGATGERPFDQAWKNHDFAVYFPLLKAGADPNPAVKNEKFFARLFPKPVSEADRLYPELDGVPALFDENPAPPENALKYLWPMKLKWSQKTRKHLAAMAAEGPSH